MTKEDYQLIKCHLDYDFSGLKDPLLKYHFPFKNSKYSLLFQSQIYFEDQDIALFLMRIQFSML